ncbi:winged helix-turn-helix domain-containing protein [Mycobacterium saskatchewanense]|uniref:Transcriptional regulator n=1 Tax=Mycobacterium saskatchewanense TaxID=220927 RepID=A0AAJ3TUV7_9MYCO|nr:response regulator transcription factor [Mycobacterium saskatchewanense]ORW71100.1 transcriptional regulator [Mycobacterium saskatchewanense]
MSLDVLLLTDQDDFVSALPDLASFAQSTRRAPLSWDVDGHNGTADVAIIDARTDLIAARSLCRRLTASSPAVAVVAVVAPADFTAVDVDWHFDDVMLPAAGADELQARLRMAVTRRRSALDGALKFGELIMHPARFSGSLGGRDLGLTLTEFRLLNFLVQHAGRAFTRTRLMHEVWGYDCNGRVRTVDVHVRRLRAKLGAAHESMIDTVRGVGYMAPTPPHPEWIVGESAVTPVWTSTQAPATDSVSP